MLFPLLFHATIEDTFCISTNIIYEFKELILKLVLDQKYVPIKNCYYRKDNLILWQWQTITVMWQKLTIDDPCNTMNGKSVQWNLFANVCLSQKLTQQDWCKLYCALYRRARIPRNLLAVSYRWSGEAELSWDLWRHNCDVQSVNQTADTDI